MSSSNKFFTAGKIYKIINQSTFWIKGPGNLKKQISLKEGILLFIGKNNGNELFYHDNQLMSPSLGLVTYPQDYLEEIPTEP
jgi:hypothetical protein